MSHIPVLAIGVGGSGIRLAAKLQKLVSGSETSQSLKVVGIDLDNTYRPSPPLDDFFFLGDFNLQEALDKLDPFDWPEPERHYTRQLSEGRGAFAQPRQGRWALELNADILARWLGNVVARMTNGAIRVLVLGSISGGTGGGLLPPLGRFLRETLARLDRQSTITGIALSTVFFSRFASSSLANTFRRNQEFALHELQGEAQKQSESKSTGYDEFYLVDSGVPRDDEDWDNHLSAIMLRVANTWVLRSQQENEMAGHLAVAAQGMQLLALSYDGRPELKVLWTPGEQFLAADIGARLPISGTAFRIHLSSSRFRNKISEFRELLRDPKTTERVLQSFLGRVPEILTAFDYSRAVPQVYLFGENDDLLIPDFMLVPYHSDLADIVELKHPQHPVLVEGAGHPRFSGQVMQAMAQLRDYEHFFDDPHNRERIRAKYGFTAYKPRLTIIIGTAHSFGSEIVFRKVAAEFRQVDVVTYDQLLSRAERLLC